MRCLWHKYVDIKTQITKNVCFGFSGAELPGYRVLQRCKKCGKERYISLNLAMPDSMLYNESLWRNNEKNS